MEERSQAYFLFRSDVGRIDAPTWWRGTLLLIGIFAVLTIGWHLIEPYADHDLNTTPLFTVGIFLANLYRLLYGFALFLILISHYNLSAKRWRDIGRPAALAGLLPLLACVAGALHWLEPRVDPALPHAIPITADVALLAVFVWNVVELGGLNLRPAKRR
jgi:uncharacterized membrane protein YhaH (DUF805 family)